MNMNFSFDPLQNKAPKGVVKKGTMVNFLVKANGSDQNLTMFFCLKKDGDVAYEEHEMMITKNGYCFSKYFEDSGHYFYHFKATSENETLFICKTFNNYSYVSSEQGEDFFQSVINHNYNLKDSLQGGIIYQIFVDRFCKKGKVEVREPLVERTDWGGAIKKNTTDPLKINEEVFCGNFAGVESKLDYLKELGVTTIYFNPICYANSNHKYDTANYEVTDPMFGSLDDFKHLIKSAGDRNINIIIDGVYNHTGSDSIYFNRYNRFNSVGAYNSKKSKYYPWFEFEDWPNKYKCWWGIDTLPATKGHCPDFIEYIAGKNGIIEKYLKLGVFGFRLDVLDELEDSFTKMISQKIAEFGETRPIIGEVWEDASTKISYGERKTYFANNEINSVMNYPIKESIIHYIKSKEPTELISTIRMLQNNYPKEVQDNLMNFLGTHDTNRIFTELSNIAGGDRILAKKYFKIAMSICFTVMGVPSIYYGDEYGMENNDGSSRGCFVWKHYKNDLFEYVLRLSKVRKQKCFVDGELNILFAKNGKFVFERKTEVSRAVICVNLKPTPLKISLKGNFFNFFTKKPQKTFLLEENECEILIDKSKDVINID